MKATSVHPDPGQAGRRSGGFTLIELLVVITIILLVSAVALPMVIPAVTHRQVSEAARILQAAIAGAHDVAIHTGSPSGIRLLPDPTFLSISPGPPQQPNVLAGQLDPSQPLAANRILTLQPAPDYTSGMVSIIKDLVTPMPLANIQFPIMGNGATYYYPYPSSTGAGAGGATTTASVLMVEECPITIQTTATGQQIAVPNEPTSWFWNVRVGDKIQIGGAGQYYTVIGPMTVTPSNGNVDLLVNDNPAGNPPGLQRTYVANGQPVGTFNVEYLFLVDGLDNNLDGYVDNIWNGVDDNANGVVDDAGYEFVETETWQGGLANLPQIPATQLTGFAAGFQPTGALNLPYTIQRRPVPGSNGKEIALPANVVIDLTGWGNTATASVPNAAPERSRMPALAFNTFNGYVDILVYPNGQLAPSTYYSSPASMGLSSNFIHFWLAERGDVNPPAGGFQNINGAMTWVAAAPSLPIGTIQRLPNMANTPYTGPVIKGEYRLVSFFSRTGQITTNADLAFDNPANPQNGVSYNPNIPYLQVQQGISGGR